MITLYGGVFEIGRASKITSSAHSLPIYVNKLTCSENIFISAQMFNANGNSYNNKNGYHLLSLFYVRGTVPSALQFGSFTCHNNSIVTKFYYSHFTNEGIEVLRKLATSQGHKLVKWLDQDVTPSHLHSKLRHLSATRFCFAGTNTPSENASHRILQVPTMFKGTGRKGGGRLHTERQNGSYNKVGKTYVKSMKNRT